MFIQVNNKILNGKRMVKIEVDRDTPTELNYHFNDGGMIKERFKKKVDALDKLTAISDSNKTLLVINDERLVNAMYIQNVEIDFLNPRRITYWLYSGAPVKELYTSNKAAEDALQEIRIKLEQMNFGGSGSGTGGGSIDLSAYLRKDAAERDYAKKDYVDGIIGDLETLLGGI